MGNSTCNWSTTDSGTVNGSSNDYDADMAYIDVNLTDPVTEYEIVVMFMYLLTSVFGICGNSLTIFVILNHRRLTCTVANCFILNLAVADDLFLLCLPFMAYSTYSHQWVFGDVVCWLMNAFWGVNQYVSIFTTTFMSIDRYLSTVYPLRSLPYRTCRKALVTCTITWTVSFLFVLPLPLYSKVRKEQCQVVYRLLFAKIKTLTMTVVYVHRPLQGIDWKYDFYALKQSKFGLKVQSIAIDAFSSIFHQQNVKSKLTCNTCFNDL